MAIDTKKLTVAMLSIHSSPIGSLGSVNTGGMSIVIRETARELAGQGHRVDIFTAAGSDHNQKIAALHENVRLVKLAGKPAGDIPKTELYDHLPRYFETLRNFVREDGRAYDLLHSHYWLSARLGLWAQAEWDLPHMITYHTQARLKLDAGPQEAEPLRRMQWERRLAQACHRLLVATEQEKETLVAQARIAASKVGVVPFGVDTATFKALRSDTARVRLGLDKSAALILFVGRFVPIKGLERLLTAVALVSEPENIELLLIGGDGAGADATIRLRSLADHLGIGDRVHFVGRVAHADLPDYYNAADLLVLPSYYESFGLVVLEALSSGTPVVATPVGLVNTVIRNGENGAVVEKPTAQGIAKTLKQVLQHCRAGHLSPTGIRASVLKFAWPAVTRRLGEQYHQTIDVKRAKPQRETNEFHSS